MDLKQQNLEVKEKTWESDYMVGAKIGSIMNKKMVWVGTLIIRNFSI